MHVNMEIVLSVSISVLTGVIGIVAWFLRRWIERVENKVEQLLEIRVQVITREEFREGIARIHERLDCQNGEGKRFAERLAKLEARS